MNTVTFGNKTTIEVQRHEEQYFEHLWYKKDEIDSIREEGNAELKRVGLSSGLELFHQDVESSRCCKTRRNCSRKHHVQSILNLQQDHSDHGIQDARGLQTLSAALSKEAIKKGQNRAAEDAIEAFNIHTENRSLCPMKATTAEEYATKTRKRLSGSKAPSRRSRLSVSPVPCC